MVITDSEFEFKFDISQLSCFWTVRQLAEQISKIYTQQKSEGTPHSSYQELRNPYLSILVGKIKTEKLDSEMRLFELLHLVLNGKQTLVL